MVRILAPFQGATGYFTLPVVTLAALANHRLNSLRPSGARFDPIVQHGLWVKGMTSEWAAFESLFLGGIVSAFSTPEFRSDCCLHEVSL